MKAAKTVFDNRAFLNLQSFFFFYLLVNTISLLSTKKTVFFFLVYMIFVTREVKSYTTEVAVLLYIFIVKRFLMSINAPKIRRPFKQ